MSTLREEVAQQGLRFEDGVDYCGIASVAAKPIVVRVLHSAKYAGLFDLRFLEGTQVVGYHQPTVPSVIAYRITERHPSAYRLLRFTAESPEGDVTPSVYFIQAAYGHGPIKIGWSFNVQSRLAALQIGSPVSLRILATMPGGRSVENRLHKEFAEYCVWGEWFRPARRLRDFIAKKGVRA